MWDNPYLMFSKLKKITEYHNTALYEYNMEIYHNTAQANKSENFTMLGRPYLLLTKVY